MNRVREWISVKIAKAPGKMVLLAILAANVIFICLSALVVSWLAPPSLDNGFWSCIYYVVTMLLSGYMEIVVEDIGETGVALVLFCMFNVVVGMIVFTGAVIGYMTDFISGFIEDADSGVRRLRVSDHIVILNWNNRAAEIINELLYKGSREKVVVLAGNDREDVLRDIDERLSETLETENIKNKLTVIVREGDPCSTKQLNDISVKSAKSVIILSSDAAGERGNAQTIKTLLQAAQLMAEEDSAHEQKVVAEVEDDRTLALVDTVVAHKTRMGDDSVVPVAVNRILGQIFSQFAIMPELNIVYSELFSNRGTSFYTQPAADPSLSGDGFIREFLASHRRAIPLTVMEDDDGRRSCCYFADSEQSIRRAEPVTQNPDFKVSLNPDFEMKKRRILLLGHNSKSAAIMEGFDAFRREWGKADGPDVLDITVIDGEASLAKQGYYKRFPFVQKAIAADIFEKDRICGAIDAFIGGGGGDRCVMILSDDTVPSCEVDADALTYLIMVQDILQRRAAGDPGFDPAGVDLVVEVLDPKNYDVVSNYSANDIVVSNRYISKIIMQVGEKNSLFDFYNDILTYDEQDAEASGSKELYIKKASEFFLGLPGPCTAADLIRAVYDASPEGNKSVALGYFRPGSGMVLFAGDQARIPVALTGGDKLILFSDH